MADALMQRFSARIWKCRPKRAASAHREMLSFRGNYLQYFMSIPGDESLVLTSATNLASSVHSCRQEPHHRNVRKISNVTDGRVGPAMPLILVVDDSAFSRGRVLAAIKSLGHRIIEAVDGQEGLKVVDEHDPDLIISDLLMPNLDGMGLLAGMRDRQRQTPVIIVSADIQASSRALCEELGAAAFLNKPFQTLELAALVHRHLPAAVTA